MMYPLTKVVYRDEKKIVAVILTGDNITREIYSEIVSNNKYG